MVRTQPSARLTADETGELDLARTHLTALVVAAHRLADAADHDPDITECAAARCRLAAMEQGPVLCDLARRLTRLDRAEAEAIGQQQDLDVALADFRAALVESLDAVRTCRSVGHAEGRCWFAPSMGADACGEVLRAAHLAG